VQLDVQVVRTRNALSDLGMNEDNVMSAGYQMARLLSGNLTTASPLVEQQDGYVHKRPRLF
jgi:hypothetical protein